MTLGQKLKELRREANMTLRDLGKRVGVDFTYLSKIENDKTDERPPSAGLLKKLARVLNAEEEELLMLAQRIPDDAKQVIVSDKNALRFFRAIKEHNRDQDFWDELNKVLEKRERRSK